MDSTFNFSSRAARKDFNENDKTFCLGRYCIQPTPMAALRDGLGSHLPCCTTTKEELKAYCSKIFTVMRGASRCDWSHFSSAVLLVSLAVFSLYWEQVFVFKGRLSLVLYIAAADNAFGTHCNFSACCTLPQWAVMSMGGVIAKIVLQTPNLIILAVVLQILDFLSFSQWSWAVIQREKMIMAYDLHPVLVPYSVS